MGYIVVLILALVLVPAVIALAVAGWRRGGPRRFEKPPMRPEPADEGAEAPQAGREKAAGRPGPRKRS